MRAGTGHTSGAPCTRAWIVLAALAALGPITRIPGGTPLSSNVITATYRAMSMTLYVIP